jgi:hypothetical protein
VAKLFIAPLAREEQKEKEQIDITNKFVASNLMFDIN